MRLRLASRSSVIVTAVWLLAACGSGSLETTPLDKSEAATGLTSLVPEVSEPGWRPDIDRPQDLPFETTFEDRWNSGNDGTAYEPCTALRGDELGRLAVDASTVRDAAIVDGQTLRGCRWTHGARDDLRSLSQFVGNSSNGLDAVKARPSSPGDTWLPDTEINGRVVGIRTQQRGGECATFVESGEAVVITMVLDMPPALPDTDLCALALRFTEATIDKMPL